MVPRLASIASGVLVASLLSLLLPAQCDAHERHHEHGRRTFHAHNADRWHSEHRRVAHHARRDRNTYSGDVAIYVRPRVGTWSYGSGGRLLAVTRPAPQLKIIDVDAAAASACSMEAGVCVIRP